MISIGKSIMTTSWKRIRLLGLYVFQYHCSISYVQIICLPSEATTSLLFTCVETTSVERHLQDWTASTKFYMTLPLTTKRLTKRFNKTPFAPTSLNYLTYYFLLTVWRIQPQALASMYYFLRVLPDLDLSSWTTIYHLPTKERHFYFNRICRLRNSLPITDTIVYL